MDSNISELAKELKDTLTDKYQTRGDLCILLSTDTRRVRDRKLRDAVKELRRLGYPVVSSSHLKGYKYGTREEVEAAAREFEKRGKECFENARALRAGLDIGQEEIEL